MIIKLSKIIYCSSEHPLYPSSNLLEYPSKSSWRCAKPNDVIANIIFQLSEPSCIIGLEIGNYQSCVVIVEASNSEDPDKWILIVNHQFLSNDDAANSKFKDQVQIFTKRELNPEISKIKFDRVKVTCMQAANPRELFGLKFIILKTDVSVDLGLDIFGRFKLKDQSKDKIDNFNETYLKLFANTKICKNDSDKNTSSTDIKEKGLKDKTKLDVQIKPQQAESEVSSSDLMQNRNKVRTLQSSSSIDKNILENISSDPSLKTKNTKKCKIDKNLSTNIKKQVLNTHKIISNEEVQKQMCCKHSSKSDDICKICNLLPKPKLHLQKPNKRCSKLIKNKKEFSKLFEDIIFALSGYVNPQRDEIRKKALKMGAKYIVNPNITNNKCTHLICAFKNTPKFMQLKEHCKIVDSKFIEDCFDMKKRMPWRRYALDIKDKNQPESEEEVESRTSTVFSPNNYDQETDESDNDLY